MFITHSTILYDKNYTIQKANVRFLFTDCYAWTRAAFPEANILKWVNIQHVGKPALDFVEVDDVQRKAVGNRQNVPAFEQQFLRQRFPALFSLPCIRVLEKDTIIEAPHAVY